jgi:hypothetical protein
VPDNQIKIIFEGTEEDGGHVDLRIFLRELEVIQTALARIEKSVYNSKEVNTRFLVSDLSHSSPAMLKVEPHYYGSGVDQTARIVRIFDETVGCVVRGEIPEDADYHVLEALKSLGAGVGLRLASTTIVVNDADYSIGKEFSRNISNALERGDSCLGSVEGALEQINIHGKAKHFTIYPEVGPSKVKCSFPDDLHDDAINSIEKNVVVSGKLLFRPNAHFPHEIIVDSMLVNPRDDELPTFDDLLGIAPAIDGALPSEAAIREIRDEWD